MISPTSSPPQPTLKHPISLPKIILPSASQPLSTGSSITPASTPVSDSTTSPSPPAPKWHARQPQAPVALPMTPMHTPQTSTSGSWGSLDDEPQQPLPLLPSLRSMSDNLLRPAPFPQLAPVPKPPVQSLPLQYSACPPHMLMHYPHPHPHAYPPPQPPHLHPHAAPFYPPYPHPHPHYAPLPHGLEIYPPPQPFFQPHSQPPPVQYKSQLLELASSREIKRRTKTGCLTCRKRRIKVRFAKIFFF